MSNEESGSGGSASYSTFKELIEAYRPLIYGKICEYVPMKEPQEHYRIMRDYIDRQGKYARPGLLVLVGLMYGAKPNDLILPAAAQQLSEDWILIQDDAEDDSELRRGKPAAQRLYGWVHSVNATNSGHMAMWRMLKDYILNNDADRGNLLYDKFYEMLAYTVEGQYIENHFIHDIKDVSKASDELYFRIADSKTCFYTVHGPMQLGAIAAGHGDERTLKILREIGTEAGIAFQIVDDILDMTADEAKFGKRRLGDLYEGKLTPMVLHAYRNANPEEKEKMAAIYRKRRLEKTEEEIKFIEGLVIKYKGLEYARKLADEHGARATALIEKYRNELPKNQYTDLYINAVQSLYKRDM